MLKSGKEYLDSLKDGRVIYIGDETVLDPTTHPAFDRIANTYAAPVSYTHLTLPTILLV